MFSLPKYYLYVLYWPQFYFLEVLFAKIITLSIADIRKRNINTLNTVSIKNNMPLSIFTLYNLNFINILHLINILTIFYIVSTEIITHSRLCRKRRKNVSTPTSHPPIPTPPPSFHCTLENKVQRSQELEVRGCRHLYLTFFTPSYDFWSNLNVP